MEETRRIDLSMEISAHTQQVIVNASNARLDLDSASLGSTIGDRMITQLPLNGRNLLQLATLSPAVAPATPTSAEAGRIGQSSAVLHVAGGRAGYTGYLLDGQESRGARFGELPLLPSPDAIAEVRIQYNSYGAEFGMNGAVISVATKSGTNGFHGALYWFLRNNVLDARQYFDRNGTPPLRMNQFGFTAGGPILRNRTFAFSAYEGRRQTRNNVQFVTVPDVRPMNGDFSRLLNQNPAVQVRDPLNSSIPFPANIVPMSRFSPFALRYRRFIPEPMSANATAAGNVVGQTSRRDHSDQSHVRLDHYLERGSSVFTRVSWSSTDSVTRSVLPYSGSAIPLSAWNTTLNHNLVISPTLINTVRLGFTRDFIRSATKLTIQTRPNRSASTDS
jgi:hypothetical protein